MFHTEQHLFCLLVAVMGPYFKLVLKIGCKSLLLLQYLPLLMNLHGVLIIMVSKLAYVYGRRDCCYTSEHGTITIFILVD